MFIPIENSIDDRVEVVFSYNAHASRPAARARVAHLALQLGRVVEDTQPRALHNAQVVGVVADEHRLRHKRIGLFAKPFERALLAVHAEAIAAAVVLGGQYVYKLAVVAVVENESVYKNRVEQLVGVGNEPGTSTLPRCRHIHKNHNIL